MATNKLLNKESLNGVFAEIKRELDNIPQNVSDLEDAEDYATKEYADARTIGEVTATVEVGGEVKQATVTKDGADVNIGFPDLQGPKGNPLTWDDLTEPQKASLKGDPGDNCYVGQGDLPLAQVVSQADNKAITPKGVQNAIGELNNLTLTRIGYTRINNDEIEERTGQHCWWAPVKSGDVITVIATDESSSSVMRIAFSTSKPAIGVSVTNLVSLTGVSVNQTISSAVNGYVIINHGASNYTDRSVKIMRYVKASELESKANASTLMDLLKAVVDVTAEKKVQEDDTLENSLSVNGVLTTKSSTSYKVYEFSVEEGKAYRINGSVPPGESYVGYLFVDSDGAKILDGKQGGESREQFSEYVVCPKGAVILYVSAFESSSTTEKGELFKFVKAETEEQKAQVRENLGIEGLDVKTVYPKMQWVSIKQDDGTPKFNSTAGNARRVLSTMRFIKVSGNVTVKVPYDGNIRVFRYNKNFAYLGSTSGTQVYENVPANTEQEINVGQAAYIKIQFTRTIPDGESEYPIVPLARVSVTGLFGDAWDFYNLDTNVYESDDDDRRIIFSVHVRVTDPTCCDDETNEVQDAGQIMLDYGRICLPPTYTNTGRPTRLIIHCHGAAVNYSGSTISNDEKIDLEPKYWLQEGYAVLDVEGNPFDDENEHSTMPQAMDCFVAAYKWAIEYFNIKRDGVFLGGRSMGGGTTLMLAREECPIPVIATCLNSSTSLTPLSSSAERKTFYATHSGFVLPEGFEFNTGWSAAEKRVWLNNWDRWIKNVGLFGMVNDLPSSDEEKTAFVDALWGANRYDFIKTLHAHCPSPIKLFSCRQDESATTEGVYAVYRAFMNTGQRAEIRIYDLPGYDYPTGTSAHHYDTQNDNLRANVTTIYGKELQNIPVVYIEMLRFWRRYEQDLG